MEKLRGSQGHRNNTCQTRYRVKPKICKQSSATGNQKKDDKRQWPGSETKEEEREAVLDDVRMSDEGRWEAVLAKLEIGGPPPEGPVHVKRQ